MDLSQEPRRASHALTHDLLTPRLRLRVPGPRDADWIARHLGLPEIAASLTSIAHPYTPADALHWMSRPRAPGAVRLVETRDGRPVGGVGIDPDLAYWVAPGARGRGIATEAAEAMVRWWFARGPGQGARRIASGHLPENAGSARILARLGFCRGPMVPRHCNVSARQVTVRSMILSRSTWDRRRRLPRLQTARLSLRPLVASDAARLAEIAGHPEVAPMIYWATVPWSRDAARAYVRRFAWTGRPGFKLALCSEGRLVGTVGLSLAGDEPELSYFLGIEGWGRGWMGEALGSFLDACFCRWDIASVRAEIYEDNVSSRTLVARLGFTDTGACLRGTTPARLEPAPYRVYRLTRSQFAACH